MAVAYYSPRTEIKKLKAQKFWKPSKKFMAEKTQLLKKYRGKTNYNKKLNLNVSVMDPERQFYRRDRTDKKVGESG